MDSEVPDFLDRYTSISIVPLAVIVVTLLTYLLMKDLWSRHFERMRDKSCDLPLPPGNMGCPFIGETFDFTSKGSDFYKEHFAQFGNIFKTHVMGKPMVRVSGADNVRTILMGEHGAVTVALLKSVQLLLGNNAVSMLTEHRHRVTKRIIGMTFNPETLATFVPKIQTSTRQPVPSASGRVGPDKPIQAFDRIMSSHLHNWCQMSLEDGHIMGLPACQQLTADLTFAVMLGSYPEMQQRKEFLEALRDFSSNFQTLPINLPGFAFWKAMHARKVLVQEIRRTFQARKSQVNPELCLLEAIEQTIGPDGTRLGDQGQGPNEDTAVELLFAGFATNSSALCSVLLALGREPDILHTIEAELQKFGLLDVNGEGGELTYDVINKLEYVHCFIQEVLRVFPPVGAVFRKAEKTLTIASYQIPKGWVLATSIRETQQMSDEFQDPERFLPERWISRKRDNLTQTERFGYIPFGAGARACPGRPLAMLYITTFVIEVVRRSRWTLKNPTPTIKYLPVTMPVDKLPITFRCRSGCDNSVPDKIRKAF